jgi:hypothetical protein
LNPFDKDLGVHQGRIVRTDAPEGTHVYELGHALLQDVNVDVGDYHQVTQTFVLEPQSKLLKASIVIVTPAVLPVGSAWELSIRLNGDVYLQRRLRPSKRTIVLSDVRISLFDASGGSNTIAFRLELVA